MEETILMTVVSLKPIVCTIVDHDIVPVLVKEIPYREKSLSHPLPKEVLPKLSPLVDLHTVSKLCLQERLDKRNTL